MKDAKGHGSDPRGAHAAGVDQVGKLPLAQRNNTWYHGSPMGEPGPGAIHVGTEHAARIALEARIGIPADGYGWHGQEYGKTLLAGQDTLRKMGQVTNVFGATGYNARAPKNDYYAPDRTDERATMGKGTAVPFDAKPAVHPYEITGVMHNSPAGPRTDDYANRRARKGIDKGIFYKNEAEDSGSISAVVPSKTYLRRKW